MAMSFNRCDAIGYLGADPEIRKLDRGGEVANFSLAATERWGGSGRDAQEHTEWFRCTVYGGTTYGDTLIDLVDKYLRKGDPCMVTGKLRTRKYQDKDGVDRYATELIVAQLQLLGGAPSGDSGGDRRDSRDSRGGDRRGGDDRGRDRGGRDDRGADRGRDDRSRGRDDRGRDDRRGRDDDRRGGREETRSASRGRQSDADLDDEIPF
jgi:single-strand DNA-binding protein